MLCKYVNFVNKHKLNRRNKMSVNDLIPVGINGFGRIGKCVLDLASQYESGIDVKVINASRTPEEMAYIFKYDTTHGVFDGEVSYDDQNLIVDGKKIRIISKREPLHCAWERFGAEYVIESTGQFLQSDTAGNHLLAGAKKVIISAPTKDPEIPMFVHGVNDDKYVPGMDIVSNASCTTNCLAPLVKVVHENFGIESALMTTVHAVTAKQSPVDGYNKKNLRMGRSIHNIIPTSTGAAMAVGEVIPEIAGKITGVALRVPVENGSIVDLTVRLEVDTNYQQICEAIYEASKNEMKGIIRYTSDPIVSSDVIHDSHTCIFDEKAGVMLTPNFVKLFAWYDNELGYSAQLVSLLKRMHEVDNK